MMAILSAVIVFVIIFGLFFQCGTACREFRLSICYQFLIIGFNNRHAKLINCMRVFGIRQLWVSDYFQAWPTHNALKSYSIIDNHIRSK